MGISATPRVMAPKSSQVGLRLSADPVGIINDPQQDPRFQAEEKEKSWKCIIDTIRLSLSILTESRYDVPSLMWSSDKKIIFRKIALNTTLLRFAVEVQVFHCVQIPLQFHCIFYRQTMQILNVKTAKKYLQWVVCKKCSETAVGFVPQWKPVVFAVKILAV